METLVIIFFAIVILLLIFLIILYKYNQRKSKIKEAEDRIQVLKSKVEDINNIIKKQQKEATDATDASEAKDDANTALKYISGINSDLCIVNETFQDNKLKILYTDSAEAVISHIENQINTIYKKVDKAKQMVAMATKKKIAQKSRLPYTILNIPFLKSNFSVDYSQRLYVEYLIHDSDNCFFPIIRAPKRGCEIKLPVVGRNNNRGASEQFFCEKILEYGLQSNFYDNISLFCENPISPYEPDLAYIDVKRCIFLDIEIDEPYVGWYRSPIHYKTDEGLIDDLRNKRFTERGWSVIRFSEKQIINEPLSCLKKIFELLHQMNASIEVPSVLLKEPDVKKESIWSKSLAEAMEKNNEREKYLNISCFNQPTPKNTIIADYKQGRLVEKNIKEQKCWEQCVKNGKLDDYKTKFPSGIHSNEVPQVEDDFLWNECDKNKDYTKYMRESKLKTYYQKAQTQQRIIDDRENMRRENERKAAEERQKNEERRRKEEYQRDEEARRLEQERQAISTNSTPSRTPSSRGYA